MARAGPGQQRATAGVEADGSDGAQIRGVPMYIGATVGRSLGKSCR